MQAPTPPPEAALLNRARESAGISIIDAARAAGISDTRWSQIERGRERRKGIDVPTRAKDGTLARMARAVGIPPDRLESEGSRPKAAEILREMQRAPEPGAPVTAAGPAAGRPGVPGLEQEAWILFPDDASKRSLWMIAESDMSRDEKLDRIKVMNRVRAEGEFPANRGNRNSA